MEGKLLSILVSTFEFYRQFSMIYSIKFIGSLGLIIMCGIILNLLWGFMTEQ